MKVSLQQKLINSLAPLLSDVHNPQRLQDLIDLLQTAKIPEKDYNTVRAFIFLLIDEMPEIINAKPKDKKLHDLFLFCKTNATDVPELSTKNTPHKRN